jgi:hypothetical protein
MALVYPKQQRKAEQILARLAKFCVFVEGLFSAINRLETATSY